MGALRKEPVKAALMLLLIIQICLIAHSNITLIGQNLDCDTGKLFNHIAEVGKQKTLFLPDWDYLTTLEWDCSSLLALPFYMVTQNIILSFGLSNIFFVCGFLGLIFFLFRGEDMLYPLFCANLLIIPFRVGMLDYYNMLFFGGGQYIIKTAIPILLAGLILSLEKIGGQPERKQLPVLVKSLMAVYLGLFFLSSISSGIYVAICGVFPLFAVYIGYKFFRWERISRSIIFLILSSAVLMVAGWRINMALMGGARGNAMTFCSVYQLLASVSSGFFAMFELYGATTESYGLQVLSGQGIALLAKCFLVIGMLVSGVSGIAQCIKKKGNLRFFLLISVFLWNTLVLIISFPRGGSSTYEYRYHLIGMIPLMCAACAFLLEVIQKLRKEQQICLYTAGLLAVLFLCGVSYKELYSRGEQNADLKEFCGYVRNLDAEHVYLFNGSNDADICRVIDEDTSYICLLDNGITWAYDYYKQYVDAPMQTYDVIVAVNEEEYQFGDNFEIAGHLLQKFDSVANRSLYHFME